MMFIESPSQLAHSSEWLAYAARLEKLNLHGRTVDSEKRRAKRMVALLLEEEELDREHAHA